MEQTLVMETLQFGNLCHLLDKEVSKLKSLSALLLRGACPECDGDTPELAEGLGEILRECWLELEDVLATLEKAAESKGAER